MILNWMIVECASDDARQYGQVFLVVRQALAQNFIGILGRFYAGYG